uniref:Uncharacterized protein n=1 Tax=uncultured prokaryote TaxID=198431 RepID=A0A0H5Q236_9ZZZZ|nr:hypothetical protein [uncultured prokaryote]
MPIIKAQCILPSWSLLPQDEVTNTFWFESVGPLNDDVGADITILLGSFYAGIQQSLGPTLTGTLKISMWDWSAPTPRYPYNPGWETSFTPVSATQGLPEEVALVLSFHASPPATPRRRGRVYLGPLGSGALSPGGSSQWASITDVYIGLVKNAATALMEDSETAGVPWCVYSTVDNVARKVVGGWVDNSPDTQRRRGHEATSRNAW